MKKAILSMAVFVFIVMQTISISYGATEEEISKVKETLKREEPQRVLPSDIRQGGLLLKKGQMELDLTFTYAHFSENQIFIEGFALLPVLVIGEITVEKIKRDIFIGSVTGKIGITDRLQFEITLPYRYQYERYFRPNVSIANQEEVNDHGGMGDVYGSLLYHAILEGASTPHVVVGLTYKSTSGDSIFDINPQKGEVPLGTGFHSLKGIVSVIKTADPAVVFLNFGYTYNFSRKGDVYIASQDATTKEIVYTRERSKFRPGDTFELGFGVAYALSYKFALNTQYQHSITLKTAKDDDEIEGTFLNVGFIKLGGVWAWSEMTSMELSTTFGVTADAPDVVVESRVSYRF